MQIMDCLLKSWPAVDPANPSGRGIAENRANWRSLPAALIEAAPNLRSPRLVPEQHWPDIVRGMVREAPLPALISPASRADRPEQTASDCGKAGHAPPSRPPWSRSTGRLRGSSQTGRLPRAQSSTAHKLSSSKRHALGSTAAHSDEPRRSRRHIQGREALRTSGSASAVRASSCSRSPPATGQARHSTGHPRKRLRLSLVPELRRLRTDDLADHFARYAKLPADRLDGLTMNKIDATDLRNRLHHQHPHLGFHDSMEATVDPCPGGPIGCRLPRIRSPYSMPKHS